MVCVCVNGCVWYHNGCGPACFPVVYREMAKELGSTTATTTAIAYINQTSYKFHRKRSVVYLFRCEYTRLNSASTQLQSHFGRGEGRRDTEPPPNIRTNQINKLAYTGCGTQHNTDVLHKRKQLKISFADRHEKS